MDIRKATTETVKTIAETRLLPEDAFSKAAETLLVENSVMPGLESALEELGSEVPEGGQDEGGGNGSSSQALNDATPRTLYVSRRVLNTNVIIDWAEAQDFEIILPAEGLHATIACSQAPASWMKVTQAWTAKPDGDLTYSVSGPRLVEQFSKGAMVLLFNSSDLTWRHVEVRDAGASQDWPDYQSCVALTYQPGSVDLDQVDPYRGVIELGPEVFEEIGEGWVDRLDEE